MFPIGLGWLGLGSFRPHPAPPVSKRLVDVGAEEDTIEVIEEMTEVISVVDMSDTGFGMVLYVVSG